MEKVDVHKVDFPPVELPSHVAVPLAGVWHLRQGRIGGGRRAASGEWQA